MVNTMIGIKREMSQTFENNSRVSLTALEMGPCVVTHIKGDKDGYKALQIGIGTKASKNTSKALKGHLNKSQETKEKISRYIREIELPEDSQFNVGDKIKVSEVFTKGDTITVTATSKGKGFQGGIKRYGFAGGPRTHGQSDRHRAPGSIGQGTTPGRVWKGKKMAGHMGVDTITIKNLSVVNVDDEKNLLFVSGPVPGPKGSLITVLRTSPMQEKQVEEVVVESEENTNE